MIDEALQSARSRLETGSGELMKTASASPQNSMVKEAAELADALEYIAHSATSNGSASDSVRGDMVRSFFKNATGSPAQSATSVQGTQSHAPPGKKIPVKGQSVGGSAPQSETTPAPADGQKPLLESFKQAEGQSLYDILMASKHAAHGGPAESTATTAAAGIPSGHENSNRHAILHSNEGPVNATKRQAKAPVRQRLAEAFTNTGKTTSDATLSAMFPQAAKRGGHKVASVSVRLHKIAGQTEAALAGAIPGMAPFNTALAGGLSEEGKGWRTAGGQLAGALGGGALGLALGRGHQGIGLLGSAAGGGLGAYAAHGANRTPEQIAAYRARLAAQSE
jgi:hypothetical protein